MKHPRILIILFALWFTACSTTPPPKPQIGHSTMQDHLDIQNAMAAFYFAVDVRQWDKATALMSDPFHLDYSSFGGGNPADLTPNAIINQWKAILPGFEHTHHQLGNMHITMDKHTATTLCYVTATHTIGDKTWIVVGHYRNTLKRVGARWQLSGIQFNYKYQTGDTTLPKQAMQRAK